MSTAKLYKIAFGLALFTIFYNIPEGLISTYLGFEDESLVLFGFGADSFIEVISGLGIAYMIVRIQKKHPNSNRDKFERTALRITGISFYILVITLVFSSLYNIYTAHKPITTIYGVIISVISILVMLLLTAWKRKVGKKPQLRTHFGRCQLYDGLRLYVHHSTNKQRDLRTDKHSLHRQHRNARPLLLCL